MLDNGEYGAAIPCYRRHLAKLSDLNLEALLSLCGVSCRWDWINTQDSKAVLLPRGKVWARKRPSQPKLSLLCCLDAVP